MKNLFLKAMRLGVVGAVWTGTLFADGPDMSEGQKPMEPEKMKKTFIFALLPKAFQDKPLLAITVLTEVTDEGKRLKPATPASPAYYQMIVSGYHKEGAGTSQARSVSGESLAGEVKRSLDVAGYREESAENPGSLLLFLVWGEHNKLGDPHYRNLLSRASLVGGQKFAQEFKEAIEQLEDSPALGSSSSDVGILNPVYQFCMRNEKNRALVDQVTDDCYFVIVSAYDKAAFLKGEKKLLWRTKMTTAAQGVSLAETSTVLAGSGTNYFGKWMTEPSIVDKRVARKTRVEAGELRVISMDEPADAAKNEKPQAAKKK